MLTVNQLRGTDSTGVIRVNAGAGYKFKKTLGVPSNLMETRFFDKEIDTLGAKALIGHCRAKTIGENTVANAHPFEFDKVIGVHNGTLRSHYTMERAREFDVDSELLYWHINEYGLRETISKLDNEGAWALVYWNEENKTLNFIRNERRPLWFAHTKDQTAMLWASEPWFFSAATRRGVELHQDEDGKRFFELPIETHLSFTIDSYKTKPNEIFTLRTEKNIKGEVRGSSGNWEQRYNRGNGGVYGNGGSVPRPFVPPEKLDDQLPRRLLPPVTQTPADATPIVSIDGKPLNSTQKSMDTSTVLTDGKNGQRPKLSLVSPSSNDSQQENNGSTVKRCNDSSRNSEKPKVSFRTVVGTPFITDNKSKTEFSEKRFEELTGAVCTFCKAPVGTLREVNEIFIHDNGRPFSNECVTFICNTCVEPNPVLLASSLN